MLNNLHSGMKERAHLLLWVVWSRYSILIVRNGVRIAGLVILEDELRQRL